ncbi:MAG: response regulator transcription factor [Chloroflexi bacterium]|nr:response regulator transcription factor [Chloroflexota bacterium]
MPPSPFLARKGVIKPDTGDTPVPPAKGLCPSALPIPVHEAATQTLSPREWDVLRLLTDGMKNREIGETLFVTENTVKTHIRGIPTKLSLKNRTQAATFALLDSRAY